MYKINKDIFFLLAIELDLEDLINFCSLNKNINEKVCKDKTIWYYKLEKEFPDYDKKGIVWNKSVRNIYETLHFIKTFLQPMIKEDVYEIYSKKTLDLKLA